MSAPSQITSIHRLCWPLVAAWLGSACAGRHADRLAPQRARAVVEQRAALQRAANQRDTSALLAGLAPHAQLIVGRDTQDLATAIRRMRATVGGDSASFWIAAHSLRRCDRWLYESGGQLGMLDQAPGRAPARPRFRYALTWTGDSTGAPRVQTLSLVPGDVGGSPPAIEGCLPTTKERFEPHRFTIALVPGTSLATSPAVGNLESAMRSRSMKPRGLAPPAGYPAPGSRLPVLLTTSVRIRPWLWLDGIATLTSGRAATTGLDSVNSILVGAWVEQKWAGISASLRYHDLRFGLGPVLLREAWHLATDAIQRDTSGRFTDTGPVAQAGNSRNRVGLLAQAGLAAPLASNVFLELRAYYLALGSSASPPAFGFAPVQAKTASLGLGLGVGVAF